MSMNGNFARSILCSLTTSVDFGLYSSMLGVCCDCGAARVEEAACSLLATRGHSRTAEQMHASIAAETEIARQDFIARSSRETRIVSHRVPGQPNGVFGALNFGRATPPRPMEGETFGARGLRLARRNCRRISSRYRARDHTSRAQRERPCPVRAWGSRQVIDTASGVLSSLRRA